MTFPSPTLERLVYTANGAIAGVMAGLLIARHYLIIKWTKQSDISAYDSLDDLLGPITLTLGLGCMLFVIDVWYLLRVRAAKHSKPTSPSS